MENAVGHGSIVLFEPLTEKTGGMIMELKTEELGQRTIQF